jgi:hypothetical protein
MEWTGGDEDLWRSRRMERAEARRKEWWTDHFTMEWLESDNIPDLVQNQNIYYIECGTAPPLLFEGEVVCQSGSVLFSSATATQAGQPQTVMEVDGGAGGEPNGGEE